MLTFFQDICHMEGLIPQLYAEGAHEIPGARSLIDSLSPLSLPWAIVTSGTKPLVKGWFKRLNLPLPEHLVTAEDVERGKPDPTCYKMGLKYLDLEQRAGEVLVVEDSPAGIRAGLAAGCKVLGLVTSHTLEQVRAAEPTWIVTDLASVKAVKSSTGGVVLQIRDVIAQT
jgi:glycerol 3-phosphatase-1